jgi:hypothetical protein
MATPDPCSVLRALLTHGHSYAISALAPGPSAGPDNAAAPPFSARYGTPTTPGSRTVATATLDEAVAWLAERAGEEEPGGGFAAWLREYDRDG